MKSSTILELFPTAGVTIQKSEGMYLWDTHGNKYIDFESGVWCSNLGHNHPEVNRVMHEQMDKNIHHGYAFTNPFSMQLSEKLNEKFQFSEGKSVFLSSGSEAVNLAITLAKTITSRQQILIIGNTYLSAYGHGGKIHANPEVFQISPDDDLNVDFSLFAAFVFEPGIHWGMIKEHPNAFVSNIAQKAKEHGCLIIIDEVSTGFGRTGEWFGYEHYDIQPDIVATGKGLGNGYPVSAVSVRNEVATQIENTGFRYAQSHQNDSLGCAVGLAVIKVIELQSLVSNSDIRGKHLRNAMLSIKPSCPDIQDVRGKGLMLGVETVSDESARKLWDKLFKKKIVTGLKRNVVRLMPPLVISKEETDFILNAFEECIN